MMMNAIEAKAYAEKRLTEFTVSGTVVTHGKIGVVNMILNELRINHNFACTVPLQGGLARVLSVSLQNGMASFQTG